jgi:hypothetical protein
MNDTPHGKISRLPHHIREQLHFRLRDGQRAKLILAWLNATAEVQQIMAVEFAARPISQRNLSAWKQRSHPAWLLQQAALSQASRFISQSRQLVQAGQGTVTDNLATFVAAQYVLATQQRGDQADPEADWKWLRALCQDVIALRRSDQLAGRFQLQRRLLPQASPAPQTGP